MFGPSVPKLAQKAMRAGRLRRPAGTTSHRAAHQRGDGGGVVAGGFLPAAVDVFEAHY
jgi:hypothetical protein